jgi:hypothetical protein
MAYLVGIGALDLRRLPDLAKLTLRAFTENANSSNAVTGIFAEHHRSKLCVLDSSSTMGVSLASGPNYIEAPNLLGPADKGTSHGPPLVLGLPPKWFYAARRNFFKASVRPCGTGIYRWMNTTKPIGPRVYQARVSATVLDATSS